MKSYVIAQHVAIIKFGWIQQTLLSTTMSTSLIYIQSKENTVTVVGNLFMLSFAEIRPLTNLEIMDFV